MNDRIEKNDPWSKLRELVNSLARRVSALEKTAGGGLGVAGLGLVQLQQKMPPVLARGVEWFWAILDSATPIEGAANRWSYEFTEVRLVADGAYETITGPRTGTCFNVREIGNAASGVQGNGIDAANLASASFSFAVQPIALDRPVQVFVSTDGSTAIYYISVTNSVDGGCL